MSVPAFLFHRKDHVTLKCKSDELSYETKTLREDRTAAEKKYVACRDPPQAENLASEILCSLIGNSYQRTALRVQMRS